MTEAEFVAVLHMKPKPGDLERANCPDAGKLMHFQCGVCVDHGLPYAFCIPCTGERIASLAMQDPHEPEGADDG